MAAVPWRRSLPGILAFLFASLFCPLSHASRPIPFKYAEPEAVSVVVAREVREGNAVFLVVDEVLRGPSKASSIPVARGIWDTRRPKDLPPGDHLYIILLGDYDELLCGHINGLPLLSGGCMGILPMVNGVIPAKHASRYDGVSEAPLDVDTIVSQLRNRSDTSCESGGLPIDDALAIPPMIPDQPKIESMEPWNQGLAVWTLRDVDRVFYIGSELVKAEPLRCPLGTLMDIASTSQDSFALCQDHSLHLFRVSGDQWKKMSLPSHLRWNSRIRLVAAENLLLLFVGKRGYFSTDGAGWFKIRSISGEHRFWKVLYAADQSVASNAAFYLGWDSGEWGGALWKVPYSVEGSRLRLARPVMLTDEPIVGIAVGRQRDVWYASGLAHLGGRDAGLYLDTGDEVRSLIKQSNYDEPAGEFSIPSEADISGLAVEGGVPYFVATSLGVYRLTNAGPEAIVRGSLYLQYKADTNFIIGSAPQGLAVMPDGALVVPMRTTGVLVLRQAAGQTSVCQVRIPKVEANDLEASSLQTRGFSPT